MMQQQHGYIRSIDVAEHLGVTKPSVTYATKRLRENGYITMDKDGLITLTDSGMAIAASMLDRHQTLTRFLMALGIDAETAETDACTCPCRCSRIGRRRSSFRPSRCRGRSRALSPAATCPSSRRASSCRAPARSTDRPRSSSPDSCEARSRVRVVSPPRPRSPPSRTILGSCTSCRDRTDP